MKSEELGEQVARLANARRAHGRGRRRPGAPRERIDTGDGARAW
jgi:hypothetical protein